MSTPDNTQQPDQEIQELTDENLEEISGGVGVDLSAAGWRALNSSRDNLAEGGTSATPVA